jgi:hypothetical protein
LLFKNITIKTQRTIISPVVYECRTLSRTFRGENRLRVFNSRMLRKIFGPKRDEVTGEWRRLHNEDLHDRHSPHIILVIKSRSTRWARNVGRMRERTGAYCVLLGKPEGKRPLGRPRRRWENIKIDLQQEK